MTKRNGDLTTRELEHLLVAVETKLERTKDTLGTLICWMTQSANSPISRVDAKTLLERLEGVARP